MPDQLSLATVWVTLTTDELAERGRLLAETLRELTGHDADVAERRAEDKKRRDRLMAKLQHLAEVVSAGREERPLETVMEVTRGG